MKKIIAFFFLLLMVSAINFSSCKRYQKQDISKTDLASYLAYADSNDVLTGGVRMIPINTPKGTFKVWTKRKGNNPEMKVLLLHGGPGASHDYFECFESYFPKEGIEYILYDQLGSFNSDNPQDTSLWRLDRFVEEVEQVRIALGLDSTNFYLLGHSWGGILAMEYATKYQHNLKGLIISNMVASIPEYNKYANEVLGPQMPPEVLAEVKELEAAKDYSNPRYMELLEEHYYTQHLSRLPAEKAALMGAMHFNPDIYLYMQGPSEFGITPEATLYNWDRSQDLKNITVPTLVIGAAHDTMDPEYMKWMSEQFPDGNFLLCPNGSHMAFYDDQKVYFDGLIGFVKNTANQ
ncbi:MAG TPA: proline iminopeptidase-family hydrolase [Bacteroidales bacterium]